MFWRLFRTFKDPEAERVFKERYELYIAMGMNSRIAKNMAKQLVEYAIEACKKKGIYEKNPDSLYLFSEVARDSDLPGYLQAIRKEGVTNEDIKEWYSLSPLERTLLEVEDEITRMSLFRHFIDQKEAEGVDKETAAKEAAQHVRRHFPVWGDPRDTTHAEGDDRPLPIELKLCELRWRNKQLQDPAAFNIKLLGYSSYNAMIRAAIRSGEL